MENTRTSGSSPSTDPRQDVPGREPVAHLDGCHYFAWAWRNNDGAVVVRYATRAADSPQLVGDCDVCARVRAGFRHEGERQVPGYDDEPTAAHKLMLLLEAIEVMEREARS